MGMEKSFATKKHKKLKRRSADFFEPFVLFCG
jgi:hypothetical protein